MDKKRILVTGAAGFIGSHLSGEILRQCPDWEVVGVDNMNHYYDVALKQTRLLKLKDQRNFIFKEGTIADREMVFKLFSEYEFELVVNLAAQAGVRYSITNPDAYIESNIIGFYNILEACRHSYDNGKKGVEHLIYASSSSVYGLNKKVPYSTDDKADAPVSLYAATKKSDELMAHAYTKLYQIPATGLRFFTVYGPMGRPDMAYYSFAEKMVKGNPIQLFNYGEMERDFTYIDDIVEGVMNVIRHAPKENEDGLRYKLYNIGNQHPENLKFFVDTLEKCMLEEGLIKEPVKREYLPMQPGDVVRTCADVEELFGDFHFKPSTPLAEGLLKFVRWYKEWIKK